MPKYLILEEGEIFFPFILMLVVGHLTEGLRKMTSSVLAALSEILLAVSQKLRPLRSLFTQDWRRWIGFLLGCFLVGREGSLIDSRLVSSAKWEVREELIDL